MPHKQDNSLTSTALVPRDAATEFIMTAIFITIVTGVATGFGMEVVPAPGTVFAAVQVLAVALAFGFTVTALAYASGHTSGGQLNPAVTIGMVAARRLSPLQGVVNVVCQILGALLGSAIVRGMSPPSAAGTHFGANSIQEGINTGKAFLGEMVGTFAFVLVFLETAHNAKTGNTRDEAPIAVGYALFVVNLFLIPFTSAGVNPARTLGPAIVANVWPGSMWVFFVGPLVGCLLAALVHRFFTPAWDFVDEWVFVKTDNHKGREEQPKPDQHNADEDTGGRLQDALRNGDPRAAVNGESRV